MFAGLDVKVLFHIRQAYQLNVEDTEQPLLIHRPKKKTGGDLRKVNIVYRQVLPCINNLLATTRTGSGDLLNTRAVLYDRIN